MSETIVRLIRNTKKRGLAEVTQLESECIRTRVLDATKLALIELNISVPAAEFLGLFHGIEAALYESIKDAKESAKND